MISDKNIDGGKPFDWGRVSADYAKYRDIYPPVFYESIAQLGLCLKGQTVLDLGTGTGVLPRNMYGYGAKWFGTDISEAQINQARFLSSGTDIEYFATSAEDIEFSDSSFDVITACQCFWYFNHEKLIPKLLKVLKPQGKLLILYMAWLPFEDDIAYESEKLILKYNPNWSGKGEYLHSIDVPSCYDNYFDTVFQNEYKVSIPFTRESWNGRVKACRGIGASLSEEETERFEKEHLRLLSDRFPEKFEILHYCAIRLMKLKIDTPTFDFRTGRK